MIAAWMLWSAGAGLLFVAAALAVERVLGRGRRWAWAGAALGTTVVPAVRFAGSGGMEGAAGPVGTPVLLEPLAVGVAGDSGLHALDGALLTGWLVLSACVAAVGAGATVRLLLRRRGWRRGVLRGRSVLWSKETGPALTGLFRPRVVLPDWVRSASPARQELVLVHEEEHLRAKDVQLRFSVALLLAAFPWNPALWFQYQRLGAAIEMDCDQRVMSRLPGRRRLYGDLLLRAASPRSGVTGMAVAALSERPSSLERRIRALLGKAPQARAAKAALLVFAAVFVIAVAVAVPGIVRKSSAPSVPSAPLVPPVSLPPSASSEPATPSEPAPIPPEAPSEPADVAAEPSVTPYTAPRYQNAEEIRQALQREYAPLLRDARVGGAVHVTAELEPFFTPYTVAPRYENAEEVRQAIRDEYPPLLRDAGIGGTVHLNFFVDKTGAVADATVAETSGHPALDEAALRVAKVFRFTPARNRDEVVEAGVSFPITFAAAG